MTRNAARRNENEPPEIFWEFMKALSKVGGPSTGLEGRLTWRFAAMLDTCTRDDADAVLRLLAEYDRSLNDPDVKRALEHVRQYTLALVLKRRSLKTRTARRVSKTVAMKAMPM